jgi:hypothetical protein
VWRSYPLETGARQWSPLVGNGEFLERLTTKLFGYSGQPFRDGKLEVRHVGELVVQ